MGYLGRWHHVKWSEMSKMSKITTGIEQPLAMFVCDQGGLANLIELVRASICLA